MTKEEFKIIFAKKLVRAFPAIEVDKSTAKEYWNHFSEVSADKFVEATHLAVSEHGYFPPIGIINKHLEAISGILSFDEVYLLIDEILNKSYSGSWKSSDYPEIVVSTIKKCGGVSSIRQMSAEAKHIAMRKTYKEIAHDLKRQNNYKRLN